MKRLLSLLLIFALLAGLAACGKQTTDNTGITPPEGQVSGEKTALLCLPHREEPWTAYGQALQARLEEQGHRVQVCYAQNDAAEQASQVKTPQIRARPVWFWCLWTLWPLQKP